MQPYTVYIGADLWGVKHNAALPFVRQPTLGEVVDAARLHFDVVSQSHRRAGYPDVVFDVASVQVLSNGAWEAVDAESSGYMVRKGSQFWLFQPESIWHSDASGLLPVPHACIFYYLLDPAGGTSPRRAPNTVMQDATPTFNEKVAAVFEALQGSAAGASDASTVPAAHLFAVLKHLGAIPTLPPSQFLQKPRIACGGAFDAVQWRALCEEFPFLVDFLYFRTLVGDGLRMDNTAGPRTARPAIGDASIVSPVRAPKRPATSPLFKAPPPDSARVSPPRARPPATAVTAASPPAPPPAAPVPDMSASMLERLEGAAHQALQAVAQLTAAQAQQQDKMQQQQQLLEQLLRQQQQQQREAERPPYIEASTPPPPEPPPARPAGPVHNIHYVHELPAVQQQAAPAPPPRPATLLPMPHVKPPHELLRDFELGMRNVANLTRQLEDMDNNRSQRLEQQHQQRILDGMHSRHHPTAHGHGYPPAGACTYPMYQIYPHLPFQAPGAAPHPPAAANTAPDRPPPASPARSTPPPSL